MTEQVEVVVMDDEPPVLLTVGAGYVQRRADRAVGVVLTVNDDPFLVTWIHVDVLRQVADAVAELLQNLEGWSEGTVPHD